MRSARTLWLIFAALLLNAAASAATTDALLREARALAEEQQFARALEILREAQRQAPEDWEIVRALARTHLWSGDVERAAALLAGSPPRELANPDTQLLLGAIAYRRSDFAAAAAHYQRVVDEFPDYADAVAGLERAEGELRVGDAVWQDGSRFLPPHPGRTLRMTSLKAQ